MAFRIIDKSLKFDVALYPRVERTLATVKSKSKTIVGGFELRHKIDYIPQVGLQENVCASECNLMFLCGQGTSGKTFSMYLKALSGVDKQDFKARLISVRALDSSKGSSIFTDGIKVCGGFANCQASSSGIPSFVWPQWNSNLQLIHSNFNYANPDEKKLFEDYAKKNQASLIMIDEATEMNHFGMFSFWFMRNRDDSGMIPQMILSFNPLHEHWTTEMLRDAGYLGADWYLRRDMIGKVRYFYVKGDTPAEIIWGDTREDVVEKANPRISQEDREAGLTEADMVKSFTVFTGTAADNRELVNATGGQSVANLHAVGGTQRAIVGEAYFGPVENEEINVSRSMIHSLWENPINKDANVYATMDISKGGVDSDGCPCIIWKGLRIIDIVFFRKNPDSDETHQLDNFINGILSYYNVPLTNFAYDANGIGGLIEDFLKKGARGISGQGRVEQEYDENGNQVTVARYFNLRSQLLGKTEIMLKKGEISASISKDLVIPYGKKGQRRRLIDVLFDEINVFITTDRNGKIYYRKKEEYKEKFKSSPDLMDAISYRAIFELDTRERKQAAPQVPDDAYDALYHRPLRMTQGRPIHRLLRRF
jgi:hypothetical protein